MRFFSRLLFLSGVVAVGTAIPGAARAQTDTLRQQIDSLHVAMVQAFKTQPSNVARFYTDDASILGGGGRYIGRVQIDEYWRQATMYTDWKLDVLEVGGGPDAPWVRGRSTLTGTSGRTMVTDYVGILRRQSDGTLRFYVDMFVGTPQMRAPGSER